MTTRTYPYGNADKRPHNAALFVLRLLMSLFFIGSVEAAPGADDPWPPPMTHGRYSVLTASPNQKPPAGCVDIGFGPTEVVAGSPHRWWQVEVRTGPASNDSLLVQVRGLSQLNPLATGVADPGIIRYLVWIPETGERFEYTDAHTGRAILPPWHQFSKHFLPRTAPGSRQRGGMPETCAYLGHVLSLTSTGSRLAWEPWTKVANLRLDRELLIGTSRGFQDAEGRRLAQEPARQEYHYVPFTAEDFHRRIEAGFNLFPVEPKQEAYVRGEAVFYLRGAGGEPPLRYPADLYRSNYLGPEMFMDEPTIITIGDKLIHTTLRHFSDATALIRARVEAGYLGSDSGGSYHLHSMLIKRGVALGALHLQQPDYPAWETVFETAHYQMEGGLAGFVHEGRYQAKAFDNAVARWTGQPRPHTAEEMLRYHFAFLRGGTQPLGKFWGTSIYGQCDPAIAQQAVTLAYDMGARYIWFWTSDHDHHVPWPEQLQLARLVQQRAATHARPSLYGPRQLRDLAIVLPYAWFPSFDNLWWVRELDPAGKNEASLRNGALMRSLLRAYHEAIGKKEDFDFLFDTGAPPKGYRRVVRLSDSLTAF